MTTTPNTVDRDVAVAILEALQFTLRTVQTIPELADAIRANLVESAVAELDPADRAKRLPEIDRGFNVLMGLVSSDDPRATTRALLWAASEAIAGEDGRPPATDWRAEAEKWKRISRKHEERANRNHKALIDTTRRLIQRED